LKKLFILLFIALVAGLFYHFDGAQYLSVSQFREWFETQPLMAAGVYFVSYVLITGLSLPGAAVMTLMGGAVFGLAWGLLLVSFASTLGATLAFLVSRSLLRDWVQARFAAQLDTINKGIARDGAYYLFSLRLIPVIPFFVINLVFGLAPIRAWTFYWVSQLGMLAGTAVFVNAGAELGNVEEISVSGIMTPGILIAFVLLALFPVLAKAVGVRLQQRQLTKSFTRPKHFDSNMLVIGGGSAGLVSALIAAAVKAKVTLVEKHKMGGDCLNTGCVPSKALIRSAAVAHQLKHAGEYGISGASGEVDFAAVMERVQGVIKTIEPHDSVERFTELGVDCLQGDAKILSPWEVQVGERIHTARNIVIATGARPFVPPVPGIENTGYLTSDTLWELREQPKRLMVMGAGPIGCELAQAFARLGSEVTLVDMADRIMPREDPDVSALVSQRLEAEGIKVLVGHKTIGFECDEGKGVKLAKLEPQTAGAPSEPGSEPVSVEFDVLMVAVGRKANTENFGLEALDVELTPSGTIAVDDYLRTRYHNIYACGDVAGPYQFTHMASHQAWFASVNALFGFAKKFKVDYKVVPWATFTAPEVARVGLNETDATAAGIEFDVSRYDLDDLDRAIADGETQGFIKVLTAKGRDKVLGATIVGYHASDLITEYVTAMKHGHGLNKILGTIHIYPTMSEANKFVAGNWKRANAPEGVLRWVEKLHRWRR